MFTHDQPEKAEPEHLPPGPDGPKVARSRLARWIWMVLGFASVAVGGIGIVVPGLPTTGFMVFAASCFAKSSPRFERWILGLPGIGPSVAAYRRGEGMPKRSKIVALSMMTIAVVAAAGFIIDPWPIRVIVALAGLVGWWFLLCRVPTMPTTST